MSASALPFYTPAQYLSLERGSEVRHEYSDGVIYAMAGGSYTHSQLIFNFGGTLRELLRGRGCVVTGTDVKVQVAETGPFFYPDVMVVCGPAQFPQGERDILSNPVLIAEVLSPSTAKYDWTSKMEQYRRISSLREYVLISQRAAQIQSFDQPADGQWRERTVAGAEEQWVSASLGVTVPLAEVYLGVEFEG